VLLFYCVRDDDHDRRLLVSLFIFFFFFFFDVFAVSFVPGGSVLRILPFTFPFERASCAQRMHR